MRVKVLAIDRLNVGSSNISGESHLEAYPSVIAQDIHILPTNTKKVNPPFRVIDTLALVAILVLSALLLWRRTDSLESKRDDRLALASLIDHLRSELLSAQNLRAQKDEVALFELGKIQLELNFVVKRSRKTSGEVAWQAVVLSDEEAAGIENLQKISVELMPLAPTPNRFKADTTPVDTKLQTKPIRPAPIAPSK